MARKQTADALTSTAANVLRAAMVWDRGIMPSGDETFAYDGAWLTISGDQANTNYTRTCSANSSTASSARAW